MDGPMRQRALFRRRLAEAMAERGANVATRGACIVKSRETGKKPFGRHMPSKQKAIVGALSLANQRSFPTSYAPRNTIRVASPLCNHHSPSHRRSPYDIGRLFFGFQWNRGSSAGLLRHNSSGGRESMTIVVNEAEGIVNELSGPQTGRAGISWAAVMAGAAVTAALTLVLLSLGVGLGMSV